ncbi:MAG: phospholipase [Anaerolineae bacterium]|nr:phospholipase [Anaerolineae bacterium]
MTRRSQRSSKTTSKTQRATVGGLSGIAIIIIVLIAQYVLGIDVLKTEEGDKGPVIESGSGEVASIEGGIDGGWYQLYFTQPINTQNESLFAGAPLENALVNALDGAQQTIDAALFEMNSQPVTDALIRAHERGVQVRFVTDGEHGLESPDTTIDQLEDADIPVVSDDGRGGFMHDKFIVIDGLYVWTGSTNITHNGIYNNNNNAILIRSSRLAANFSAEFEELFSGEFGKTSPNTIANPSVNIEGTQIETIFESEGNAPARLVELINQAHSVRFMAFSLTRDDLIQPLLTRAQNGQLDLKGIVEASSRQFVKDLFCAGLDMRQDGNPDVFHHKVFIIDESIVVMGSFNFSARAADDNDENLLIIHNTDIASAYLDEFNRRWAEAQAVSDADMGC